MSDNSDIRYDPFIRSLLESIEDEFGLDKEILFRDEGIIEYLYNIRRYSILLSEFFILIAYRLLKGSSNSSICRACIKLLVEAISNEVNSIFGNALSHDVNMILFDADRFMKLTGVSVDKLNNCRHSDGNVFILDKLDRNKIYQ